MIPLVGLSCYRQEAAWGSWRRDAATLPASYVETVGAAGGRPVLLPPFESGKGPGGGADAVAAALDALVLVGGEDVGENVLRDESERALLSAALERDLPVLAVCRGHQLLNVVCGGTLVPHLPDVVGHTRHQPARGRFGRVEVTAVAGSAVAVAEGESFTVLCSHHQAVDDVGRALVVTATSSDGVIEAVELAGARFVVGVQFHPEEGYGNDPGGGDRLQRAVPGDARLFEALVAVAGGSPATGGYPEAGGSPAAGGSPGPGAGC